mgnify:FL=1
MGESRMLSLLLNEKGISPLAGIGIACLLGAVLLALVALLAGRRQHNGSAPLRTKRAPVTGRGRFWQQVYSWLAAGRATRRLLQTIRSRLEQATGFDERGLRRQSACILVFTAAAMVFLMVVFALLSRDVLLSIIFAGMLGFMADALLDFTVTRVGNRLLRQQVRFHEQVRHRYYEEMSVDGAVEEACQSMLSERAHEMFVQGEKLLDMLSAADTEAAFELYCQTAPNRYLKLLAGLCRITREYGDPRVDGGSVFLRSLGHLSDEIRSELFKRERLLDAMRSLNVLTLLPLFFIRPIRDWAGESFAPMARFYAQGAGTVLEVLLVAITLGSHLCIRKLQHVGELRPENLIGARWEMQLYGKWLQSLLDRLTPPRFSLGHLQLETLLRKAVSPLRVPQLQCRRFLAAMACMVGTLLLCAILIMQQHHRIMYEPDIPKGFLGGSLSPEDRARQDADAAWDRSMLAHLPRDAGRNDIVAMVESADMDGMTDIQRDEAVERLVRKTEALRNNRFWWWQMLLCLLAMAGGWQLPILMLRFQSGVRALDMEDEVARFQTIILMLMHMPRVSVEEMVEWMEMFSLHFREALQTCLSDYSAGPEDALSSLRAQTAFEPMANLIGNLILAATDLPILQAFEELESEKAWSREKRKELNERVVERKRNLGNLIGFLPLSALIGLYLMVPMVYASMTEMQMFYQQMSAF